MTTTAARLSLLDLPDIPTDLPPPPTLTREQEVRLFADLAQGYRTMVEILNDYHLDAEELEAWLNSPRVLAKLACHRRLAIQRAELVAIHNLPAAMAHLANIATGNSCERPSAAESARRSATTIIKTAMPPKPTEKRRPPHPTTPPQDHTATSTPAPAPVGPIPTTPPPQTSTDITSTTSPPQAPHSHHSEPPDPAASPP